jgi:hypothetical protein
METTQEIVERIFNTPDQKRKIVTTFQYLTQCGINKFEAMASISVYARLPAKLVSDVVRKAFR